MENQYDLILIDDDTLVHMMWKYVAKDKNLKLLVLLEFNQSDFLSPNRETPIYIDKNLIGRSGIEVAKVLHDLGFSRLYIASGEALDPHNLPSYISGIQGKEFPLEIK